MEGEGLKPPQSKFSGYVVVEKRILYITLHLYINTDLLRHRQRNNIQLTGIQTHTKYDVKCKYTNAQHTNYTTTLWQMTAIQKVSVENLAHDHKQQTR